MQVVIIGGVATGPKVAARLRRLRPDAAITIIEQGELISYGACGLPLYLGNLVPDIQELMMTSSGSVRDPEYFEETRQVKVLTNTRAEAIDRGQRSVKIRNLRNDKQADLPYDYLVLATGASPVIPSFPGKDLPNVFTLHHPNDALALRELVQSKKINHLTIIGAGLIGMEAADAFKGRRLKVTVCEAQTQILPKLLDKDMAALAEQEVRSKGVDIRLSCRVMGLIPGDNGFVAKVETADGLIDTDAVIMAIGSRPNVELARSAGLELGNTGAMKVNSHLQTNDPAIFAGGDCVENIDLLSGEAIYSPLASTANKHGRVIADNIAGRNTAFPGVNRTSVLQCFEQNIGRTGLGTEEAVQKGLDVTSIIITGYDSAHYHPFHDQVKVKLIAENGNGRIVGGQVVGSGDGVKRLDVLVTAMKYGATLDDLATLDLGYAPPFSTAIDLIAHAANSLGNKINNLVSSISALELVNLLENKDSLYILDVRTEDEVKNKPIPYAHKLELPLSELHQRWIELREKLPHNVKLVTVCELGIRGYEAACLLQGKGLSNVFYLEGGLSCFDGERIF